VSRFVLRLAWRETRGAWRHFGYFFACITLGVSALVGVGSFADSLERTVARSAKSLMGGDVEIRSTQPLPLPLEDAAGPARGAAVTRVRELVAMAQTGPASTQLVELKAVEPGYPFYGALVTDPPGPLDRLIGEGRALVHESFLARLGLRVGDRFRVGQAELTVAGVIVKEPDRAVGVFSLGPGSSARAAGCATAPSSACRRARTRAHSATGSRSACPRPSG
jgi:putative ABC transport system permease protein